MPASSRASPAVLVDTTASRAPRAPVAYPATSPARRPLLAMRAARARAPAEVPITAAAFGTPLQAGPTAAAASRVLAALAPLMAVWTAATPVNRATTGRRLVRMIVSMPQR